ncbi:MAG TPA: hypothetical protein VLT90_17265 [Terriglobales bacterium]|nr:hypothetical protein [Terriglobales bacterium]
MSASRVLYQMARADFLERVRRYSFLLTLAFAIYLGYATFAGHILLRLDDYRGIYNSAWLGGLMALVSSMFLSLVGFYIVKNSIQRDQDTRVGRILATTPMTKTFYTMAKTASNFAVLASMVAVMAGATVVMQFIQAEDRHIDLWALLGPLILLSLPCMAFTAALAVLFETLPLLRSGMGNVIYFFLWSFLLVGPVSVVEKNRPIPPSAYLMDFGGIVSTMGQMQSAVRQLDADYKGGSSLTVGNHEPAPPKRFVWQGIAWNQPILLGRVVWISFSLLLVLIAAVFFHRFDPAREWRLRKATAAPSAAEESATTVEHGSRAEPATIHLTPMAQARPRYSLAALVMAELRIMLKGKRWWWYAVAGGLSIACLASPLENARGGVLVAAWIWPILVWSSMGARERRNETESLIFSSARALPRQLPAVWIAGVVVALLTGGGVGIRLLLRGDFAGAEAFLAGAFFVPSLALALGVWSGSSKPFEAIYTAWWYVGPAHHTPGIDFMGVSAASSEPVVFAMAAVALVAVAYWGRRVRMGYA